MTARPGAAWPGRYHAAAVTEQTLTLEQQLEEIRTQLAWVRDYL
jgi:hypothetical protein